MAWASSSRSSRDEQRRERAKAVVSPNRIPFSASKAPSGSSDPGGPGSRAGAPEQSGLETGIRMMRAQPDGQECSREVVALDHVLRGPHQRSPEDHLACASGSAAHPSSCRPSQLLSVSMRCWSAGSCGLALAVSDIRPGAASCRRSRTVSVDPRRRAGRRDARNSEDTAVVRDIAQSAWRLRQDG